MADKSSYAPTIIAVLLVGIARLFGGPSDRGYWMFIVAVVAAVGLLWLVAVWMKARAVRFLTRLDEEGRQLALAEISDLDVRAEIKKELDEEPVPAAAPPVERFPFPRRMSRELAAVYVAGALVTVGGVSWATIADPIEQRALASGVALTAAIATIVWGWQRSRLLSTSIEISPFAISEVGSNGSRRTMLWRDVWWLRNRPWLGRIEVLGPDKQTGIFLHYDRVAFKRAVELVADYGGFVPRPAGPQAPPA